MLGRENTVEIEWQMKMLMSQREKGYSYRGKRLHRRKIMRTLKGRGLRRHEASVLTEGREREGVMEMYTIMMMKRNKRVIDR